MKSVSMHSVYNWAGNSEWFANVNVSAGFSISMRLNLARLFG